MAFPGQLPAWHKLMEQSSWRAATAGAPLARARIQDWVSVPGESSTARLCLGNPTLLGAMVQGHPKIQLSVVGTTSRLSLCHQVAAPARGSVPVLGLAHAGHSPAAACDGGLGAPGVCGDTGSRGLVPGSHKVCAKVWPLLLQRGMELRAAQAEGLMVGSPRGMLRHSNSSSCTDTTPVPARSSGDLNRAIRFGDEYTTVPQHVQKLLFCQPCFSKALGDYHELS